MNIKKITALLASVAMVATMFVGCGTTANKSSGGKTSNIKVGLSTDEGGLNDKSFNQSADKGLKKAVKDFGIQYTPIESTSKEDYMTNLGGLVDNGSDLVVGVGYQMQKALEAVAKKNPDTKFVIVDSVVDLPNVQSYTFKQNEGSFLMGVIAGKMTKTNKVGFIGGKDLPLINNFEAGFVAGVMAVNPEAGKLLVSRKTVKYADSFGDVNKGYEIAKALYGDGCDIIYHAAGGVGLGLFSATKELRNNGKNVWAIGVDMDQAVTTDYGDYLLSSMVKRVDTATYEAAKEMVDGTFKGGKAISLGLKEKGVDIAPSTSKHTPKDVLDLVEKYRKAIVDGKFQVPANLEELKKFTPPQI
ncbi:membrane lipoprotein TmpC precursor [Clostridium tepidiprofundi DSM 19306]|uniref:Membrane lipoprotein TmpC n=1 Tax=Clostridium tepidiprofundi DSM 19306 TaxID=1121338 RepID=A0A151B4T2_9CLOT|nr:BMP family ABC transporter substrate-binding protein [Clostridium tepidiprofundi]KYH34667.1 membrane lipoprotein TmpC precursor [Clostridium tepidiprofundi DSM 19306]